MTVYRMLLSQLLGVSGVGGAGVVRRANSNSVRVVSDAPSYFDCGGMQMYRMRCCWLSSAPGHSTGIHVWADRYTSLWHVYLTTSV